ncbi:hypothetical protein AB9H26_22775, partial [Yersinia enterocolitica]
WFDENMTGLITHAKAVEIIKAEMSATTAVSNKIKAQGIDEWIVSRNGRWNGTTKEAELFAASLRGAADE